MFSRTRKPRPGEYFTVHRLTNGETLYIADSDGRYLRGMQRVPSDDFIWDKARAVGRYAPRWWRKEIGIPLGAVLPSIRPWSAIEPRSGEMEVKFTIVGYSGTFEALDAALKRLYDAEGWEIVGQSMSGSPKRQTTEERENNESQD